MYPLRIPLFFRCLTALLLGGVAPNAEAQEFRAMWADTFHAGLRNSSETSALIAAARAAHCNAVIVEVRKRGDAYYRNGLEPVASDVAAGFDPLADLIQKGHNGTPRVEVHAWIVAYNIWNDETDPPPQPTHPYNLHPDWLNETNTGRKWTGNPGASGNYLFDPGHPGVQQHTFNVAMDIITRYDVDGFHFDYIRYPEYFSSGNNQPWGYNPVTVARYKKLKNLTTTPGPTDAAWLQWRREQVSALVRKVYLNAWALKPNVRISAALIPWGNPPASLSLSSWQNTEAYARVLQDWRGWMEEGILDLACPMVYRNEDTTPGFDGWADFTKDRQYNRAAAIGMGWYLNSIRNTILQIKNARTPSPGNKFASGIVGYSYAVPNKDGIARSVVWDAFTDDAVAETYDPGGTPVFANVVGTPAMPWKTSGTRGHIIGYVREDLGTAGMDGLTVTITGPVTRTLTTDATGFFGAVDLPPGNYTISVSSPGYRPETETCPVVAGTVSQRIVRLESVPLVVTSVVRSPTANTLTIIWNSKPGRTYRIEGSNNLQQWSVFASRVPATGVSTTYQWSIPVAWSTKAFVRVAEEL